MEIFQWMTAEESLAASDDGRALEHVEEEMADVFSYLLQVAMALVIDLESAFWKKAKKNDEKFAQVRPGDPV